MALEGLHDVIQVVMGWADYHLHHFQFGDVMYGAPTPEDREMNDGRKVKLLTALVDGERVFQYLYDYGDGWCCAGSRRPDGHGRRLSATRRRRPTRGPPEDVGGPWGYGEFLEAIADTPAAAAFSVNCDLVQRQQRIQLAAVSVRRRHARNGGVPRRSWLDAT
jgi:hypothetical protein